jgi:AcrR family transcriptional regulator
MTSPESQQRRPGRPRRQPTQGVEVRAKVAAIAERLFREEGFEAVSMRRIAGEAGMSTMSLYDYFRSKNEILRGIWEGVFTACFDAVECAASSADGTPRHRLVAGCQAYCRYWIEHPDEYRLVFMVEDRVEREERYFVDTSSVMSRYQLFADLVGAYSGVAPDDRAALRDLVNALICALNGVCHMLITVREFPWPDASVLVDQVLRMTD